MQKHWFVMKRFREDLLVNQQLQNRIYSVTVYLRGEQPKLSTRASCVTEVEPFSFLMLQSLAVLSSYRPSFPFSWRRSLLSGVTSGGNLKRPSALPGYRSKKKKDQPQTMGNGSIAATRAGTPPS